MGFANPTFHFLESRLMQSIPPEPIRIILVDDNPDVVGSLGMLLELQGFQVSCFLDPASALEKVNEIRPHACVLDIMMPKMNGYDLARKLRGRLPDSSVVLATVTAIENPNHLDWAVDAGFDLHFQKPADPGEIGDQIQSLVRKNCC
jgi:two-component system, OmpR family, response regulator